MAALIIELTVLGIIVAGFAVLLFKLFWPKPEEATGGDDQWAQHNDSAMPSLEKAPGARDTSVDAAIAAQIVGDE